MREFIVKEHETFPYKGAVHEMPELIRCKDCKHYENYAHCPMCFLIYATGHEQKPDDFCSRAERKEE